ncbi:MAG TPA: hypothetical protein VGI78_10615 [Acetobacteraceae bacterium]|jgi:hypothetical protein
MGGIISGIGSLIGGQQASSADKAASNLAQTGYKLASSNLSPYISAGDTAETSALALATGSPTGGGTDYVSQAAGMQPGQMTEAELQQTPGYQWQLGQGLKSVQSAAAAKGLGVSGSSLKGAATYATGLADSNYQNQFNNAQTRFTNSLNLNTAQQGNLTNQFNRLNALTTTGESAAKDLATTGAQYTNTAATALENAGTAESSGTKGLASGVGNALNSVGSATNSSGNSLYGTVGNMLGTALSGTGST